jgi:hypothetical protein
MGKDSKRKHDDSSSESSDSDRSKHKKHKKDKKDKKEKKDKKDKKEVDLLWYIALLSRIVIFHRTLAMSRMHKSRLM